MQAALLSIITALIAFIGILYQVKRSEINALKVKLRDKKESVYKELYSFIFDLFNDILAGKEPNSKEYLSRYMEIKKLILIHASEEVVSLFAKLNMETEKGNPELTLRNYFKLMVLTRKELGYKDKKVDEKVILQILVGKESEYNSICKKLGYSK